MHSESCTFFKRNARSSFQRYLGNYGRKGCGEMQAKAPGVAALTLRLRPRQCTFLARKVRPSIFRGDIRVASEEAALSRVPTQPR